VSSSVPAGVRAILLDIEGTTTPISFVFDVLFPHARTHLRDHVTRHRDAAEYTRLFNQLREEQRADQSAARAVPRWIDDPPAARLDSLVRYLEWLMDRDRKSTPLKELQGKIWEEGYRRGELQAEIFPDVPAALERWTAQGLRAGIYSSGSVLAQQLLFRHTPAGDLTRFLAWYFDTTSGAKTDSDSYRRIASAMAIPSASILFISDVAQELDAARAVGMHTRLSIRPGNPSQPATYGHTTIRSFEEL
jgi:enolase-phosphatase E1